MSVTELDRPAEVQLSLEGPRPQRRVTVFFRVILAIPHLLYAMVLGFVGTFAVIVTWFAALILGRVPAGLHGFLTGILEYITRVYSYAGYLLTDRYPSFSLQAREDAVSVFVPPPGRLNRVAVLFRIILMIPAMFVASIVSSGVSIALFFIWLIVLITGRMPSSIFEALAVVLRYQVRAYAYFGMLTSEYPRNLFGDAEAAAHEPGPDDEPLLPPVGDPTLGLPATPRITRFALSKAGKRLVILFIVLGVLSNVGTNAASFAASTRGNGITHRIEGHHDELAAAVSVFSTETQTCGISGGATCVHDADRKLARAFTQFRDSLDTIKYPRGSLSVALDVEADAGQLVDLLNQLAATSDPTLSQGLAARYQRVIVTFDEDYQALLRTVRFGR